jgi:hypothetical protein
MRNACPVYYCTYREIIIRILPSIMASSIWYLSLEIYSNFTIRLWFISLVSSYTLSQWLSHNWGSAESTPWAWFNRRKSNYYCNLRCAVEYIFRLYLVFVESTFRKDREVLMLSHGFYWRKLFWPIVESGMLLDPMFRHFPQIKSILITHAPLLKDD